jgi:hypothetical protein
MDETYGTSCVICVMCCVCMGICSLVSIYRCRCVTVATCVSACIGGSAPSLPWLSNRNRPMFCARCRIHLLFVWCHISCALVFRYHSCFMWCSTYHLPRGCNMLPSCARNSVITCFHAFHVVGLCCTGHSHMLLRVLCLCPFSTHGSKFLPLLSAMSDVNNTWRYSMHMLVSRISISLYLPDDVIVSMIVLSFSLPCVGFHSPVICTVASHLSRCAQIAVIQFSSMMAPAYCLYDCSNTLPVQPHSIWVKSIIMRMSFPVVSMQRRCPSR